MALQDSNFRFTDPNMTGFVVKPYTANGPASPSVTSLYSNPSGVSAISANTSLVYVGRGTPFYGEVVLGNMTYMLEHFANKSRPSFPIIGQIWYKKVDYTDPLFPTDPTTKGLYIWNGTTWDTVVSGNSKSPQLDLNGNRIINVGNAISPGDAVNLATADSRYVQISGSNMSGLFRLVQGDIIATTGTTLSMIDSPSADTHVVNRGYLNLVSQSLNNSISILSGRVDAISASTNNFISPSGGTMTGNLTFGNTATLILQSGGGAVLCGGRMISNINVTPLAADDAASKQYVDNTASTLTTSINNNTTSINNIQTSLPTTYLQLTGGSLTGSLSISAGSNFVLATGTGTVAFGGRNLQNVGTPVNSTDAATKSYVDSNTPFRAVKRWVYDSTNTSTLTLPDWMGYVVGSNKMTVYEAGARLVRSTRSNIYAVVNGTNLTSASNTGLAASTAYPLSLTVNGTVYNMTVTTGTGTTSFAALVNLINAQIQLGSVPANCALDVYSSTALRILFQATTAGVAWGMALGSAAGSLIVSITGVVAPPYTTQTGHAYDFVEVGNIGSVSTSISLTSPAAKAEVEVLQ